MLKQIFFLIFLVFLSGQIMAQAVPAEVKWLPDTMVSYANMPAGVYDHFYPLGWSEDGKFAYGVIQEDDVTDSTFLMVIVLDLVVDSISGSFVSAPFIKDEPDAMIKTAWIRHEKEIISLLAGSNVQIVPPLFKAFPLFENGSKYSSDMMLHKGNYLYNEIDWYKVYLSRNTSRKLVTQQEFDCKEEVSCNGPLFAEVRGYIRSPYEERIAIIVLEKARGFEGVIMNRFSIYGASLKYGF